MSDPKIWFDGEWYQARWIRGQADAVRKDLAEALAAYINKPPLPTPEERAAELADWIAEMRITAKTGPIWQALNERIVESIQAALDADREARNARG